MRFLFFLLVLCTVASQAFARAVTLQWNPVDDEISNYRLHWGTASRSYTESVDVGTSTEYRVEGLLDSVRYYFTVTAIDYWGNESQYSNEAVTSGNMVLPEAYELTLNYPNPFNDTTQLRFNLPQANNVHIAVYNSIGQQVRVLEDGSFAAGSHHTEWDGTDDNSSPVSSGAYFCVLRINNLRLMRTITLLR